MRRSTIVGIVVVGGSLLGAGAFAAVPPVEVTARATTSTTSSTAVPSTTTTVPSTTTSMTTSTTTVSTTTAPATRSITIHGVGDTNFDPAYIPNLASEGYAFAFQGLDGLFVEDDLTI